MNRPTPFLWVAGVFGGLLLGGGPCRAAIVVYSTALQSPWRDVDAGQFHDLNNTELGTTAMRVDFTGEDQRFAFYPTNVGPFPPPNSGVPLQGNTILSLELYAKAPGNGLDRIQMFLGDGDPIRTEYDSGNAPLGWNPPVLNTWTKYSIDLAAAIPGLNGTWTVDRLWLRNRFNDTETFWVRNLQFEAPAAVPEPASLALFAAAGLGLYGAIRRRRG